MGKPVIVTNGLRGPAGDDGPAGPAGGIQSIVAGANVTVNNADPANPVVAATGGGGGGLDTATIHALATKTPVDGDEFLVLDSAASFVGKKSLGSALFAYIKGKYDSVTSTLTNKDLTSGTNTFPTLNQNTTGLAGSATKLQTARAIAGHNFDGTAAISIAAADVGAVPTTRAVNAKPLTGDISLGFSDIATGVLDDDQQRPGAVIRAYCDDGITWKDALGNTLTGRPSSRADVSVEWIDTTPAGAAPIPAWGLANRDTMGKANGGTGGGGGGSGPTPLLTWYGTGLANAHVIAVADAGTGDSPAVASIGGTTAPTIAATAGPTGAEAVSFAQAAAQVCNLHYTVNSPTAVPQGRARFFLQTPAAWYASSQGIFRFTDASDALLCGITLRGSGTPGALSINDTTNANVATSPTNTLAVSTWYRVELVLDQTGVIARLYIFNISGALIYDSGNVTGLALGTAGTWAKAVWGPTVSSVTTSLKMAKLKMMSDPATAVGAA